MSSRRFRFTVPAVLVASLVAASLAVAASQGPKRHNQANQFQAVLIGHNEVPAVHTNGQGRLSLTIADDEQSIAFELTYSNLINPAQVAHVHFAQPNVNGAVSFFFCGGAKPACPAGNTSTPVTVSGTVIPADVLGSPPRVWSRETSARSSRRSGRASRTPTSTQRRARAARSAASSTKHVATGTTTTISPARSTRQKNPRPPRAAAARQR